jgi:zeta-carotene desaturase
MDMPAVIIFGGGLSGLSAAVELSAAGRKVLLLEQNQYCGGRTHSFFDSITGDPVDNGQHLMMGCYHATRRYLRLLGTEHLAHLQPKLRIEFLQPSQHPSRFVCSNLLAPFHLLVGLIGFTVIPFNDRLGMLRVAKEILYTSPSKEKELDRLTVNEWMVTLGQSDISRKYLWDIITIGALNNHPQNVSALMLFRVLRAAFLGKRENSSLLIPKAGLSELFVNPAIRFIEAHGGNVLTSVGVESLVMDGSRIKSVLTPDGIELRAKSFVSAVPWYVFEKLLPNSNLNTGISPPIRERKRGDLEHSFHSSPIISIHLWFDRKVTDLDFAALLETRIQWFFNKTQLLKIDKDKDGQTSRQYLSLVISGAQEFVEMSKEELVAIAMEDLRCVLPDAKDANVVHSLVIKEKRATFLPKPGFETLRPDSRTEYENLFLAGDWTATGYPATIEGAVMSGRKAADLVL